MSLSESENKTGDQEERGGEGQLQLLLLAGGHTDPTATRKMQRRTHGRIGENALVLELQSGTQGFHTEHFKIVESREGDGEFRGSVRGRMKAASMGEEEEGRRRW